MGEAFTTDALMYFLLNGPCASIYICIEKMKCSVMLEIK